MVMVSTSPESVFTLWFFHVIQGCEFQGDNLSGFLASPNELLSSPDNGCWAHFTAPTQASSQGISGPKFGDDPVMNPDSIQLVGF